ncbi:hypothetical protein [Parasphingorhabdus litoris]|uniref:hypothetical protein n=1 Tax=Parasphingorhabdus litoris TaxID=394733 RepID=UPI001E4E416A|nr:hypothetical protein [Parasphingorhabdus litoris]
MIKGNNILGCIIPGASKNWSNYIVKNRKQALASLFIGGSTVALSLSLNTEAQAQAVPAECTPNPALTGDTIVCVAPAPAEIDGIATTVDDLTVVVGDAATPTTVNSASSDGISIRGGGSQTLNIVNTGSGVIGANRGVDTIVTGGVGDLTVVAEGEITGNGSYGVSAENLGTGAVSVTTADVTSSNGVGILAVSLGGGVTVDSSAGMVMGGDDGVSAGNFGTSVVSVTTADVTSSNGVGIKAVSRGAGVIVDSSAGTVMGGDDGIRAEDTGAGLISVTTADVTGTGGTGIFGRSFGGGVTVHSSAGTVMGGHDGVFAEDARGGAVSVTVDDVTGTNRLGILARSFGGGVTVHSSAGTVMGGHDGIFAEDARSGAVSVTTADVTGTGGAGIYARSFGGGVTVNSNAGAVMGGNDGIFARDSRGGAVSVTTADVTSTGGTGIFARSFVRSSVRSITVNSSAGTVMGDNDGIRAEETGFGSVSVTTADVTGTGGTGIFAFSSGGIAVNSSAGTVVGGDSGIVARDASDGAVSVTTADVTGTNGQGIFAFSRGGGITVDSSAGTVIGSNRGIVATDTRAGDVSVTVDDVTGSTIGIDSDAVNGDTVITLSSTAVVTGQTETGIDARSTGTGRITIQGSSGDVVGATDGIFSRSAGAAITIDNLDSVTGNAGDGIDAMSNGGNITITDVDTILGTGGNGILAAAGTGDISIQGTGRVGGITGTNGAGILAINFGDIAVDSGAGMVVGSNEGIFAQGGGSVSVTTADVTGTGSVGINAGSSGGGVTVDSSAGTVIGGDDGIRAQNTGAGNVSVTVNDVTGDDVGILTRAGSGTTMITLGATADVEGTAEQGIFATSTGAMANITVQGSSGTIVGGTDGLEIGTMGADILVDNIASITGNAGDGIDAMSNGGNITITDVDTILGTGGNGILAVAGTGDISIQGTGRVGGIAGTGTGNITIGGVNFINGAGILAVTEGAINIGDAAAIGDVTSSNGNGIFALSTGRGVTVDSSASTVMGGNDGIFAVDAGTGSVSVTTADVTGTNGQGIFARSSGGDIMVDSSAGAVMGGIVVQSTGIGAISVTTADVTATRGAGIFAFSSDGGGVTVDSSAGTVMGSVGIRAWDIGAGDVSVTVDDVTGGTIGIDSDAVDGDTVITLASTAVVTGQAGAGIDASSTGTGTITIQGSSGDVVGATDGIYSRTAGTAITIDNLDSVTGQAGDGIDVASAGGAITITSVDTITGTGGVGILANSAGGDVSIQDVGTIGGVTGTGGTGIFADTRGGTGGNINIGDSISNGNVSGRLAGIVAYADVAGSISIDSSGSSVMGSNIGIFGSADLGDIDITAGDITTTAISTGPLSVFAVDGIGSGDVNVTLTGNVTTDGAGVAARAIGMGSVSVDAGSGTVTSSGTTDAGILAVISGPVNFFDPGTGTDIIVSSTGDVTGGTNGIETINRGFGSTTITALNSTGTIGDGINAISGANATDLSITSTGTVIGGRNGIYGGQNGSGILNINANNVTGSGYGILTRQSGAGAQTIVANNVTATTNAGIFANGSGSSLDITVTGTASGLNTGIDARNEGSGALAINAVNATGTNFTGIFARNGSYGPAGTDLSITTTGTVSGATGINAVNNGTGLLSVMTADVTGTSGNGIFASNSSAGTNLVIGTTAGDVVSANDGIRAENYGSGILSITSADVTGTARNGIFALNSGTDLTINSSTGTVTGGTYGIRVENEGAGATVVHAQDVSATDATYGRAVSARTAGSALSITAAGDVNARVGIYARHSGSGDTIITANNIEASQAAIDVRNQSFGAPASNDLIVRTTGIVSGGISAVNSNAGSVSVSTNSVTAALGFGGNAITALGFGTFVDVNATGNVVGDFIGIRANNGGSGAVTVSATNVSALTGTAIDASSSSGTGITITTTGVISGLRSGIEARSFGTGEVNIQVNEALGQNGYGILAVNGAASTLSPPGTDLIIEASGPVSGAVAGIFGRNYGTGILSIEAVDVAASDGFGIYADQFANPGRETGNLEVITAGLVTGSTDGIKATNRGTGMLLITTADVTGTAGNGIEASGRAASAGISIDSSAGSVTGGLNGINVSHSGTDSVVINTAVVSGGRTGIFADAGTGDLLLDIGGDVTGGDNGIVTVTERGTDLTVAVGQIISGGTTGIATMAQGGSTTSNDTLNILGTVSGAIMTFEGDDIVTVADSGTVNGAIMLGAGADTFNFNGGTTEMLRGGDDADTLNFDAAAGLINNSGGAGDSIAEFETYNFNVDGYTLGGSHVGLNNVNFNAGETILLGTLSSVQSTVATGASLQAANGAILNGNLTNGGSLGVNMAGFGNFAINGDFTQTTDGDLTLNVGTLPDFDSITVSGDVTLAGNLTLNQSEIPKTDTITLIDGGTGLSGRFDNVNGLFDGVLVSQELVFDRVDFGVNLVTKPTDLSGIGGLSINQRAAAQSLTGDLLAGRLVGGIEALTLGLDGLADEATLPALLDELVPEIANAGIDGSRFTQSQFLQTLLNIYQPSDSNDSDTASVLRSSATNIDRRSENGLTGSGGETESPAIWGSVNYNYHRNDTTINNIGYRSDGFELTAGIANIDLAGWKVGFAARHSDFDSRGLRGTVDTADSDLFRFGIHGSAGFGGGSSGLTGHIDLAVTYGTGENGLTMVTAGGVPGFGATQTGKADSETYGAGLQITIDGNGEDVWPVRPFVSIQYDHFSQDSIALVGNGITDLQIDAVDFDRITFGYGLNFEQDWDQTSVRLSAVGYHHRGDTQSSITSRFIAAGPGSSAFTTLGFDIENRWQLSGGISQGFGDGWSLSADGHAGFGDLKSFGGAIKIKKRF